MVKVSLSDYSAKYEQHKNNCLNTKKSNEILFDYVYKRYFRTSSCKPIWSVPFNPETHEWCEGRERVVKKGEAF